MVARGMSREEDLPAQQYKPQANTRFPRANEDSRGQISHQSSSSQGPQAACGPGSEEVELGARPDFAFPREARLLTRRDFSRVLSKGRRLFTRHFILYVCKRDSGISRLGLTISKKVGPAVVRNRIKRCVREAFRTRDDWFDGAVDLVVIAKKPGRRHKKTDKPPILRDDVTYGLAVEEIGNALRRMRGHHNR